MSFDSDSSILDVDAALFAKLRTLGLPETISMQGFMSLLHEVDANDADRREIDNGPQSENVNTLRGILSLLANCLVGRHEVHCGRQAIKRAKKNSDAKGEIDLEPPGRDSEQREDYLHQDLSSVVLRRQDLAYRGLSAIKVEYEIEIRHIHELDNQNKYLESEIRTQRELLTLLSTLKLREETRLERLGEPGVISYIRSSRKESTHAMQMLAQVAKVMPFWPRPSLAAKSLQPNFNHNVRPHRHTNEAIANLYRLHAKLVREKNLALSPPLGMSSIEGKVNLALQRLRVTNNDESVTVRYLINLASYRIARRKRKTDIQFMVADEELDIIAETLQKKSDAFQEKLNRAIALEWMCETLLQLITVFRSEVGPNLKHALRKEAQRVEGFLDNLRRDIRDESKNPRTAAFTASPSSLQHAVRSIMCIPCINLVDDVDNKLQRVFESKRLTQATSPLVDIQAELAPKPHQVGIDIDVAIDAARSQNLLERKSKKADHGWIIGDDVRALLADIKRLR